MSEINKKTLNLQKNAIGAYADSTDISEIFVLESVDSTNTYAKKLALGDAKSGTVVIANNQTAGRGRLGRTFYSPSDTGIYMSILLRNTDGNLDSSALTIAAGVAVCRAISSLCNIEPQIKWVNDIFVNNKKVCGILAEAGFDSEILSYIIVGIGINISTEVFPGELSQIAGSLKTDVDRNIIAGEILNQFFKTKKACGSPSLIDEYKFYSLVLNKKISFTQNGEIFHGTATDINIEGNLIVTLENSETVTLKSGEISLGSKNFT